MEAFHTWARTRGLRPTEARYARRTKDGSAELQFSLSGDPEVERTYRTHYVSPVLSERKQKQLDERLKREAVPTVFEIMRKSQCSECGAELEEGSYLFLDGKEPLCLGCAHMDDLEFLSAGDAAMTRRAAKYSGRSAVVVRFSRSRGRYERQGILVEVPALGKAERECAEDADERARQRARGAEARSREDRELVARMTEQIRALFPACPPAEAAAIAAHTAVRGSGRVGRSAAGRSLDERALTAAVTASIRHRHTKYDGLLASGTDRETARERVGDRVQDILATWRVRTELRDIVGPCFPSVGSR